MTYACKPASRDALEADPANIERRFIVYDEESFEQEGIYASEQEAQKRCEALNRSATDNPAPSDVHPDQKM